MNIKKLSCFLLISLFHCNSYGVSYYGVLRGSQVVQYKSPYNGIVDLNGNNTGDIGNNRVLFSIKNIDYISKIEILDLKIERAKQKRKRFSENLNELNNAYKAGFISLNEYNAKQDEIKDIDVTIKEYITERESLQQTLNLGTVAINNKFSIQEIDVENKQYVNSGDVIMKIELLDNYHVDIKFDPVALTGRIHDKKITFRSLVTNLHGTGKVYKVSNFNSSGTNTYGLKVASISIEDTTKELYTLLDTAFEINISD